jgi:putative tryptophan/tyrosine transport system substrate-binding protein
MILLPSRRIKRRTETAKLNLVDATNRGGLMRRREFLLLLSGVGVAWPHTAHAQQQAMPVIGYFDWGAPNGGRAAAAFRRGLADAGYVEGRNVAIEYRWAEGRYERLRPLAADLVDRRVTLIVATGTLGTAEAAKAATESIPIVVAAGGDPVRLGLAASLNRPGGNLTGMTWISNELSAKRLDLLHQLVPQATTLAFLTGPQANEAEKMSAAARALGLRVAVVQAHDEDDFALSFATMAKRNVEALIVGVVPHFTYNSKKIVELAARHKIPAIYPFSNYTFGGGLMSYGADMAGNLRYVGINYVARILNGANPADLPIQQPTKFPLIINLKTARALDLEIPRTLLALADVVIE